MDLFGLTFGLKSRYFAFGDWIRGISLFLSGRGVDFSDRSRDLDLGLSRTIFGVFVSPCNFGGAADFTLGVFCPTYNL